jgi:organic radical activating enzyme
MIPINTQAPEKRRQADDGSSLEVHSLFYTIQGEGPYCGYPSVFVRLAGCNLQCPSCDTEYTEGREHLHIHILGPSACRLFPKEMNHKLVVITGGEPFRQNIGPFVKGLIANGTHVQIETNGTLAPSEEFLEVINKHPDDVTIVCSPKAGKVNPSLWPHIDAYKYVLDYNSMDLDGLPIRALNHTCAPRVARPHEGFNGPIYLQPMDPKHDADYMRNVRAVKRSCMQHGYILQLQIHKIIGVE